MTNPNIPPEIADQVTTASDILNSLESALMALDPPHVRLVQGASDFVAVKNWLHDKRAEIADPAPAPVRISPEVREFIMDTLSNMDIWTPDQLDMREDAIAFVEAMP